MNKFERWCARHESLGIKNLILYIIAGQALVLLLAQTAYGALFVTRWLTLIPSRVLHGEVWRLITFAFIPSGNIISFIFFCLLYYFIGTSLEREWGRLKFTIYYLSGMLFIGAYSLLISIWFGDIVIANTHWLNMSLFLAYAALYPDTQLRLYFIIPIKMKWVAVIDMVYLLLNVALNYFPGNLLPLVAIANFFCYFAADFVRMFRRSRFESRNRIDFRKKTREIERVQKARGYRHRCTVCGRTDTEYPNLEFRYCSLCRGYPCYCEEHIMTHVHIE